MDGNGPLLHANAPSLAAVAAAIFFTLKCGHRLSSSHSACKTKWLVEKTHAHIEDGRLVPDSVGDGSSAGKSTVAIMSAKE